MAESVHRLAARRSLTVSALIKQMFIELYRDELVIPNRPTGRPRKAVNAVPELFSVLLPRQSKANRAAKISKRQAGNPGTGWAER